MSGYRGGEGEPPSLQDKEPETAAQPHEKNREIQRGSLNFLKFAGISEITEELKQWIESKQGIPLKA